jgi:hypothetical protein
LVAWSTKWRVDLECHELIEQEIGTLTAAPSG